MIKKFIIFISIIFQIEIYTNIEKEVFEKHKNNVFIETGTFMGNAISMALEVGFKEVYSIELSPTLYQYCDNRFKNFNNVHLFLGDSSNDLEKILSLVHEKATIWLDGHYSGSHTAMGDINCPILQELQQIAKHPIKNHTILIDDVRLFGTHFFDFIELEEAKNIIKSINPKYIFYFEKGYVDNDVLVAKVMED